MQAYYVKKRRKNLNPKVKRRKRWIIGLSVVVLLITALLIQYFVFAVPSIRLTSEEKIRAMAMIAIEDAAIETFTSDFTHADLMTISVDNGGNISLVQANTMLIHSLVRIASIRAQENLARIEENGVSLPLGIFTGFRVFAGYGRDVNLRVLSVGVMDTVIESEFFSAGINQTMHRLTLHLSAQLTIIMPGLSSEVHVDIPVPIIESTIVGRVPDVFFQNDLLNRSLNLIP